ncbi:hypothetical protein D3C81_690850 [compost metagenome]
MRCSCNEKINTMAMTPTVNRTTQAASHSVGTPPLAAAPQTASAGKRAAAMPV